MSITDWYDTAQAVAYSGALASGVALSVRNIYRQVKARRYAGGGGDHGPVLQQRRTRPSDQAVEG